VIGRLAGVLFACACLTLCVGSASAEVPAGPRLTFMEAGDSGFRLVSVDPAGGDRRVIVGGNLKGRFLPFPFSRPSWSGDGTRLVFAGIDQPGGRASGLDVYEAAADGTGVTRLPGTADGLSAVVSPDGSTLAFAREREWDVKKPHGGRTTEARSASIWLLDIDRGAISQLTPWRDGLSAYPSSFSPDGSILAISRQWRNRHVAVAIRLDGSGETVLARNAGEPVYSPDGTRLALTTVAKRRSISRKGETVTFSPTDLAVAAADGSGLTRLTRTRNLELAPSWDPLGQRIAYTLLTPALGEAFFLGAGDSIMEINADGSCKTKILSVPKVTLFGATWQPGPGREAGPISC
jgi:Tol biopolymer transport system component